MELHHPARLIPELILARALRPPGGPFPRASLQAEFGGVAKDRVCHTNRNGCADRRG